MLLSTETEQENRYPRIEIKREIFLYTIKIIFINVMSNKQNSLFLQVYIDN